MKYRGASRFERISSVRAQDVWDAIGVDSAGGPMRGYRDAGCDASNDIIAWPCRLACAYRLYIA
jgi:hypothetical protein